MDEDEDQINQGLRILAQIIARDIITRRSLGEQKIN